jgi:hypothetical protein
MRTFLTIVLVALTLVACEDKPTDSIPLVEKLKVTVQPTYGSIDLQLDSTYVTPQGYDIQFTDLKFYASEIGNSSTVLCRTALFDFRSTGKDFFNKEGKHGDYNTLSGNVGIGTTYNHADPTVYDVTDPLNIQVANDMYWTWGSGYIFLKVEARVDTIPDGIANYNHFVTFHVGSDAILQPFQFTGLTWTDLGSAQYHLPLKLDMLKFLDNGVQAFDLTTEFTSHSHTGEEAISLKVIQNFKDALGLY